jgi:hypothetical protein
MVYSSVCEWLLVIEERIVVIGFDGDIYEGLLCVGL